MKFSEIINDQQLATEAIRRWITIGVCIVVAVVAAIWIVNQQLFMFAILAAVVATTFVTVGMQRSAWILIVFGWNFKGQIHALFVPMETRDVVVLVVACSYVAQRAVGQSVQRVRGAMGALVSINCAYFMFTYALHPVGVRALGAETMGARPYFNTVIAWCAYWIVVHMPESYKSVTKIPLWIIASMTFSGALAVAVYVFPPITPYVWFFYGDIDVGAYIGSLNTNGEAAEVPRFMALAPFGVALIQFLSAYFPPRTLLNPLRLRFYLFLLGFVAIFASGFRNSLLLAFAYVALAALFHRGWRGVVIGGIVGSLLLGFVLFGQGRYFTLPLAAQRSLGSLPGQWDDVVKDEIKSSNSRLDWWRQIIEEKGIINNWWTGDGFGITEGDFALIYGGTMHFQEAATISGSFHNGPLTTIHDAGLVGLALFYTLMIAAAVSSVKCVNRCRDTPLFPVAVFLAIQLVWAPVHFTFVFGSYDHQLTEHLFLIGLLTLVWRMSERPPPSSAPVPTTAPLSRYNVRTLVST